ncbi:hypothetical protein BH753_gp053 [Bacillus phage Shbh1]|uniref:Uncharacterized protein n=1 Tax=Bacillus phage Shbh1 TaxID=1796992 RepID=A0A142F178_9CAUD|nr:hypothetical protein BH753_gp053 [Bacillus phage Shbh1]AMQ66535.1 hypothetical protein [Bacillus phage Shbh1]
MNCNQLHRELKQSVQELGFTYIADRALTHHPDDWYLKVIYASKGDTYATWIYNAIKQVLVEGHYFSSDCDAMSDFLDRR